MYIYIYIFVSLYLHSQQILWTCFIVSMFLLNILFIIDLTIRHTSPGMLNFVVWYDLHLSSLYMHMYMCTYMYACTCTCMHVYLSFISLTSPIFY